MTLKKSCLIGKKRTGLTLTGLCVRCIVALLKKMNFPVLPEGLLLIATEAGFMNMLRIQMRPVNIYRGLLMKINIAAPKFTCFRWLTLAVSNGGKGCYYDVMKTHVKPLYFKLMPTVFTVDIGTGSVKFYDTMPEAIETHPANLHQNHGLFDSYYFDKAWKNEKRE